ncbi:MAG: pyruvate kinase, partial [Clostridia bacterium]|nr:pyruvate kinase [Clostridia bacterium]
IMVARGDLGVEVPFEELPSIQKSLIKACRICGKRSITATEMLESMIKQPRPTRAEISDVANAVYDGSSVIMLSGETAAGAYPVEAVKAMAKIAAQAEANTSYIQHIAEKDYRITRLSEALSHSACTLAQDIGAKVIVVCTRTGGTARTVSRFRPMIDIIGMTTDERAYRKLALSWGVIPVMSEEFYSVDVLFHYAKRAAINTGLVAKGDKIVLTGGTPNGKSGNSNLINVETISTTANSI